MSLVHLAARSAPRLRALPRWRVAPGASSLPSVRFASSRKNPRDRDREREEPREKHGGAVSTAGLVPGSQRVAAGAEHARAEERMQGVLERLRRDAAALALRASGRTTPALLAPVRVRLPAAPEEDARGVRLEEVATVGVREGTTLIVTVFEEPMLKHVEQALYDAKIPHVVPQRLDSRTIKIPMPKPTVEARQAVLTTIQKQAEEARTLMRKQHQASIKKGKYAKHSVELEEFQTLTDKYLAEIDKVLAESKKNAGASAR